MAPVQLGFIVVFANVLFIKILFITLLLIEYTIPRQKLFLDAT